MSTESIKAKEVYMTHVCTNVEQRWRNDTIPLGKRQKETKRKIGRESVEIEIAQIERVKLKRVTI